MVKRSSWLSITPEPERELPQAVATLRLGHRPSDGEEARERARIERLLLRGSQRRWLSYLGEVTQLIVSSRSARSADVIRARALARTVISNHHALLLGLPGRAAQRTAADRAALQSMTTQEKDLHEHHHAAAEGRV